MHRPRDRIEITKVPEEVIIKIERLAREAKTNRTDYLRTWLTRHASSKELTEQRFMYEELVQRLTVALESQNEVIAELAGELKDIKSELEGLRSE